MIEELLVDSLRVLVGEQAADCQLLVHEVSHGELLANELRGELGGQQSAVTQQGGGLRTEWGSRVVRAGRMRQTVRLRGGVSVTQGAFDGKGSWSAQRGQMAGRRQQRWRTVVEDTQVQISFYCTNTQ